MNRRKLLAKSAEVAIDVADVDIFSELKLPI